MSTCPDSDLYSALLDGEVPSPWKEKLEAHLDQCPNCKIISDRYSAIKAIMHKDIHVLSSTEMESSFERLCTKRELARISTASRNKKQSLSWTQFSVRIPVPALAAMFLAALFLPAYFILKGNSTPKANTPQYAAVLPEVPATSTNIGKTMKTLATATPVYSPDLSTFATTESQLTANQSQLFTMVEFARQFATNKELFSDAEIIIIKLPKITQFNNTDDQLFQSEKSISQSVGFYR